MQLRILKWWELSLAGTLLFSSAIASPGEYAFAQPSRCKPKYSPTGQLIGCFQVNPTHQQITCLRRLPNGDCITPRPHNTDGLSQQSNPSANIPPKVISAILKQYPQAIQQLQKEDPQAIQKLRQGDAATLQKLQQIEPGATQILQPYLLQRRQTPPHIHQHLRINK